MIVDQWGNPMATKAAVNFNQFSDHIFVGERNPGDFQRGITYGSADNVLTFATVFACVKLISDDVAKLPIKVAKKRKTKNGPILVETEDSAIDPLLNKPNSYQYKTQFIRTWVISKLVWGNAYVFKERDRQGRIRALHVLNPRLVTIQVTDEGDAFYTLGANNLTGQTDNSIDIPASEIIHDRLTPLYHPLCGISPLTAISLSAVQGLAIQNNSASFFQNGSSPAGVLSLPEKIKPENADRLKKAWDDAYSRQNSGRVAVLSADVKYTPLSLVSPQDSQLIEQLKLSSEMVTQAFLVPPHKVNVGGQPTYNNVENLSVEYLTDCLHTYINDIEELLTNELEMAPNNVVMLDVDSITRMDTASKVKTMGEGTIRAIFSPNEARQKFNLPPRKGGDTPFLQEQNYPIDELVSREPDAPQQQAPQQESDQEQETANDNEAVRTAAALHFKDILTRGL